MGEREKRQMPPPPVHAATKLALFADEQAVEDFV
jgi:hypothetical protein